MRANRYGIIDIINTLLNKKDNTIISSLRLAFEEVVQSRAFATSIQSFETARH